MIQSVITYTFLKMMPKRKNNRMSVSATINFYRKAGICLHQIDKHRLSVSSVVLKPEVLFKKRLFALLSEVLKKRCLIETLIENSNLCYNNNYELIAVLHDYLYIDDDKYQKKLSNLFPIIHDNVDVIQKEWIKLGIKPTNNEKKDKDIKYIRLNLLQGTKQEILSRFDNDIVEYAPKAQLPYYIEDLQIPNLFMIHSHLSLLEFHKLSTVQQGYVFVQDKASCLSAHVLNPPFEAIVLDACAAPGNKTTHLAMLLRNTGKIFAIEKNKSRFLILSLTIKKSNATNIQTFLRDFLSISPDEAPFCDSEYILLDPSCSGSHPDIQKNSFRLTSLSNFQKHALIHATRFPKAKRIVYSTCSMREEENESVVAYVLNHQSKFRLCYIGNDIVNGWNHRGNTGTALDGQEQCVLRADPEHDNCHAFFVAAFERCDNKV